MLGNFFPLNNFLTLYKLKKIIIFFKVMIFAFSNILRFTFLHFTSQIFHLYLAHSQDIFCTYIAFDYRTLPPLGKIMQSYNLFNLMQTT